MLPDVFVGPASRLVPVLQVLCYELALQAEERGRALPPWRAYTATAAMWLSSCCADVTVPPLPPSTDSRVVVLGPCTPSESSDHPPGRKDGGSHGDPQGCTGAGPHDHGFFPEPPGQRSRQTMAASQTSAFLAQYRSLGSLTNAVQLKRTASGSSRVSAGAEVVRNTACNSSATTDAGFHGRLTAGVVAAAGSSANEARTTTTPFDASRSAERQKAHVVKANSESTACSLKENVKFTTIAGFNIRS